MLSLNPSVQSPAAWWRGQSQAAVAQKLQPQTAHESDAAVTPADERYAAEPFVDVRRYNPSAGFAAALASAIAVAYRSKRPVLIDDDYELLAQVTIAALSGPLKITGRGTITYAGSAAAYMLLVQDTNGHDVEIEGVTFDCDSLAAVGVRVNNASASMADANIGRFVWRNAAVLNAYMPVGGTVGSSGIVVDGGFSEVILDNFLFRNIDREATAGINGSQGSSGAIVTFSSINAYPRKTIVRGGVIDTVTSEDALGSGEDFDYDGIIIAGPVASDNGDVRVPISAIVDGTEFINCRGRCVKSQLDGYTIIRNVIVRRDAVLPYADATDFDFQRGGGAVENVVEYIEPTGSAESTFGSSHAVVGWAPDQLATADERADGGLRVANVTIYNGIPVNTDVLPYLALIINGDTDRALPAFSMRDVAVVGGRVDRAVRCTAATTGGADTMVVRLDGVEAAFTTSLVNFAVAVGEQIRLLLSNNVNLDTSLTPVLVELASDAEPLITAHSNQGFAGNYLPQSTASALGAILRPGLIGGPSGADVAHAFAPGLPLTLDDDETGAFPACGTHGIAIITSNYAHTVQAVLAHDGSAITPLHTLSSDVSEGDGSNPDVDGDLNIWISGGQINLKNRLGSTRVFTLWHFGGSG